MRCPTDGLMQLPLGCLLLWDGAASVCCWVRADAADALRLESDSRARCLPDTRCCSEEEAESSGDDDFAAPPSSRRRRVGVDRQPMGS